MRTRVLIVGGGPVGLTLAMDLAWRGIDVVVAERRPPNDPPKVKCGQIGARSMEIFRLLGMADKLRGIGLPADYPNDIVSATSVTGTELSRVPIPARGPPWFIEAAPARRPSAASLAGQSSRRGSRLCDKHNRAGGRRAG
jgi:2-polyprenyl-6-methoxyphenol hydroxylase-like FAD-dependent oxidoreductase